MKTFMLCASFLLVALLIITATAGLFWPSTYALEKPQSLAEATGVDAVNLFFIAPVLLLSAILAHRGSFPARFVWMGTLMCILYNGVIYAFRVHWNAMFLAYCGFLGLGTYALIAGFASLSSSEVAAIYAPRAPAKITAAVLLFIALVFGAHALSDVIPSLYSAHVPQTVIDGGMLPDPVYVLDLSLALPAMVVTAILLLRRKPVAFVLAPAVMAFIVVMTVSIEGMIANLALKGFGVGYVMPALFFASGAPCAVLMFRFLRRRGPALHAAALVPATHS